MSKTIGVVLKRDHLGALDAFDRVFRLLPGARFVSVEPESIPLPRKIDRVSGTIFEQADLVVVLGGDGTLIHASSLLRDVPAPVLGVNLGRLGFMAAFSVEELDVCLPAAIAGELPFVDRGRLDARVLRGTEVLLRRRILNDAALTPSKMARLSEYRIECGDRLVTSLRSDGVVIATPSGSTAYSMAAGGAILSPGLDAMAITPVSPHSLTQRPLVVTTESAVRIYVAGQREVHVTLDGQVGVEARPGDHLEVVAATVPLRLLQDPSRDYFHMLRDKLGWGEPLVDG